MDYLTAMLISAAVIVIYTVMGGFLAASFTDLIQSIIIDGGPGGGYHVGQLCPVGGGQ